LRGTRRYSRHELAQNRAVAHTGLGVAGFFDCCIASAWLIAMPMGVSRLMLFRSRIDTRVVGLEFIQTTIAKLE
jgi:hypothetical protein